MDGGGRCAMTAGVLWMRTSPAESSVGHVRHIVYSGGGWHV